jgi:hypothetical protein
MRGIVSHDAGGAELLASYVARAGGDWRFVLQGPARKIFERRLGAVECSTIEAAIGECDEILTGSSWQSDLEWLAIGAARTAGKKSITFLDHWVNYRERFLRDGVEHLPDALWVGDSYAEEMARFLFPVMPIQLVENPYFEDIRADISRQSLSAHSHPNKGGIRILFVAEPLSEHAMRAYGNPLHWGYTEFDALRYLQANLSFLGAPVAELVIRPHPSEEIGKYGDVARELGTFVRLGGDRSLIEEVVECDVVVGCSSMAMVVGLLANKRVCCAIPPGGQPCSLPHREIELLGAQN